MAELTRVNQVLRAEVLNWECQNCGHVADHCTADCDDCPKCGSKLVPQRALHLAREEAMGNLVARTVRRLVILLHRQDCPRADCIGDQFTATPNAACITEVGNRIKLELDATAREMRP
jgi:hypothetical protein